MRIASRLIIVSIGLLLLGLLSLVVLLPRIAGTSQVRDTIEQASTEALGRPLQYGELSVGILPPRIELSSPRIAGATAEARPLFAAERIDLRIALLPLLRLAVLVDSLVIDGLEVEVVRTAEGFELPMPPEPTAGADAPVSDADDEGVALAIRSIRVTNGSVSIVDRSVRPPATITLAPIEIDVHGVHPERPVELDGRLQLVTGGEIAFGGRSTLDGVLDLRVELKDVVLAPFGSYAGEGVSLDGTVSGEIVAKGPSAAPESVTVALVVDVVEGRSGDAVLDGPIDLEAALQGDLATPTGSFSVDATRARIRSAEVFDKPRGVAAAVSGRFAPGKAGATDLTLDRVALSDFLARGRASVGDTVVITLDADSFPFENLRKLSPATVGTEVDGRASLRGWKVQLEPLSLGGELVVEQARAALADGGSVEFKGRVLGRGDGIDWVDFDVAAGGQHFAISGKARELVGRAPFSFEVGSVGVLDANALLTGLDPSLADVLYGPMVVTGKVSGVAFPGTELRQVLDLLEGSLDVDIGRTVGTKKQGGRIVGFSALGSVAYRLEQLGEMARITTILLGGNPPDLSSFTGEAFDSLDVRLRIRDGLLQTDRLRINYAHHSVDLTGTITLADQSLDMNGEIQLDSVLAAALGANAKDGELTVRLAHVRGTLEEPKVEVSKAAIASLSSQLITKNAAVKGTFDSAEKIAPGSGRLLEKAFEGVMGAGKKQ